MWGFSISRCGTVDTDPVMAMVKEPHMGELRGEGNQRGR